MGVETEIEDGDAETAADEEAGQPHSDAASNLVNESHSKVQFSRANGAAVTDDEVPEICIDDPIIHHSLNPDFPGLSKEELVKFMKDPYWVRLRWILLIVFWLVWFIMLIAAVVIIVLAPRCPVQPELQWWQKSVIYQCYPRSFMDSNSDGSGDLNGIRAKLDYFAELDVKSLWLSAIYPSSGGDEGVVNHTHIDPLYGTLDDFRALVRKMHKKGMKLILDLIPNQTSKNHSWFQQSHLGDGNYTDYYIWHKGASGGNSNPPNNWETGSGSAWQYDAQRGQYYLYQHSPDLPLLNLHNPLVQQEIKEIAHYWLRLGVDGFRLTSLDQPLYSHPHATGWTSPLQAEVFGFVGDLRRLLDTAYDQAGDYRITPFNRPPRLLLVEAEGDANQTSQLVSHEGRPGAHMVVNPALLAVARGCAGPCLTDLLSDYLHHLPQGFPPNWKVGDSGHSRVGSRTAEGSTRLISMLLLTLPGTPLHYYGDEISMRDTPIHDADQNLSRADSRGLMQWSNEPNAGFTKTLTPWIPPNADYVYRNIKAQRAHGAGITDLEVYGMLATLRDQPSFLFGQLYVVPLPHSDIMAYVRQADGFTAYLVAMHFPSDGAGGGSNFADFHSALPHVVPERGEVVASTCNFPQGRQEYSLGQSVSLCSLVLHPGEGVVFSWPWTHNLFTT